MSKKTNSSSRRTFLNIDAFLNILLTFLVLLLQSWFADGIAGSTLFPWWGGGFSLTAPAGDGTAILLATMLTLSFGVAWLLWQRRKTFLPVQIQRIGQPGDIEPHSILAMTVSRQQGWKLDIPSKRLVWDKEPGITLDLSGTVDEALARLAGLERARQFTWEQLLRAMQRHAESGVLREVYLIGSPGKSGTAAQFQDCRDLLRLFYPALPESAYQSREADFEAIDKLLEVYTGITASCRHPGRDLVIDVTGGTKVVSIAAAMVTLEHPEIEFQYVETGGEKRVRSFNVVSAVYDNGAR